MANDVIAANLGHQRLTGAANGVALTTTAAFTGFIKGTEYVDLIPRNLATAVVVRYALCPYGAMLVVTDALASRGRIRDASEVAQDGSTATSVDLSSLPTLANGGAVWIGSGVRYRGAHIDVDSANDQANNLTVHYPALGSLTLTDISDTDNTDTGNSLAVDGTVTWTVPSGATWAAATLREVVAANSIPVTAARFPYDEDKLYWTRWTWNATMGTATTLDHILLLNESTAYAETPAGLGLGMRVHHGLGLNGVSGIEALTDAGTGNLLVVCSALNGYFSTGVVR